MAKTLKQLQPHKFSAGDTVKVVRSGKTEWCKIGDTHTIRICKHDHEDGPVYVVDDDKDDAWIRECNLELVERDRQNGVEWKRHRAGRKQPVEGGVFVEYKLRGGVTGACPASKLAWSHMGDDTDVMQYCVISQPQAEEVEIIKVDPVVAANVEALNGQWQFGQVDGPLVWRDTVNELDAYIEKYTRERDALIERLASEGFALIPPVVTAKTDVLPFEEWQVGDVVEVTNVDEFCNEEIKVGDQLPIIMVDKSDDTVSVGIGTWSDTGSYKFIRRP